MGFVAGEHLEEHDAGGVDVRAFVGTASRHPFGRNVGHRPDQLPGGRRHRLVADGTCQTEVSDLDLAAVGDEDVLGLDVAMHQPVFMGAGQGRHHRLEEIKGPHWGEGRLLGDDVAQGAPRHVFHDDERAIPIHPLVEDRHHMRVDEPGCRFGLGVESFRKFRIESLVHDLDRDNARKAQILGSINGCHPATSDFGHDLVATLEDVTHQRVSAHGHAHDYASRTVGEEGGAAHLEVYAQSP